MDTFVTPDFLENRGQDQWHELMKTIIPEDIDLSEGSHGWNMTRPTALVAAQICEFLIPEVIRLVFPEFSYGEYLNEHAKGRNISRRAATAANGELTITGDAGTVIQAGSLFSSAAVNDEPSVDYKVLTSVKIPASGTITAKVQCTQKGIIGNAPANAIVLVSSRITGIRSVTNPEAVTGGTEEESDEALIARILEYDQSQGNNYVGSVSDFKRWAFSVDGVGGATVIPAQDEANLVTIVITDSNGDAATEHLCTSVYNYIMSPDNPDARLAPINTRLSVKAPSTMAIGITATVELADGATLDSVKEAYMARLVDYLATALDDGEIKYTRVAAALAAVEGANDFSDLQVGLKNGDAVNYGVTNIPITTSQLPTVAADDLILTVGTV